MKKKLEVDPQWEETKRLVDQKWGRKCIFYKCLTVTESKMLIESSPKCVDRCHILSRGNYPEQAYNPNNIVPLQRFIHRRMDDYKNPINNNDIELNEHYYWWIRIHEKSILKYDPNIDYELQLKKTLKLI